MDSSSQLRMMVYASLFAALTAVGAFLAIPIGPVPIVLQNMFVYLAGLLLGVFEDPDALVEMGRQARRLARPDAAEAIVAQCAALVADTGRG